MKCIYLQDKGEKSLCTVDLPQIALGNVWEIDDKTMSEFCIKDDFIICPRLKAYMEYLEKTHK